MSIKTVGLIVMTEQNLNDPDVGSAFQEMSRSYGATCAT